MHTSHFLSYNKTDSYEHEIVLFRRRKVYIDERQESIIGKHVMHV